MANSSIIGKAKNKIIKEFIKDPEIVAAIGCSGKDNHPVGDIYGNHIFDYHQNPNTINTVETFLTVQVHIPQSRYGTDATYVNPTIEIWIISHERHMRVDNVPKITQNRNDYLSTLIDKRLNGNTEIGFGEVKLLSNIEGCYQKDYVYRQMIFQATDLSKSLCDIDDDE